ncbi:hypothetical protein J6590_009686 [Homalodisca vitripennis]|nr:hypothetical protein J6590_009686 [Homalodisca vitripennis]
MNGRQIQCHFHKPGTLMRKREKQIGPISKATQEMKPVYQGNHYVLMPFKTDMDSIGDWIRWTQVKWCESPQWVNRRRLHSGYKMKRLRRAKRQAFRSRGVSHRVSTLPSSKHWTFTFSSNNV